LAHQALVRLPVDFIIQWEATYAFVDGVEDQELLQLLMGGIRLLNKVLNQALKLEAVQQGYKK
jgi:hypothetical protein